MILKKTFFNQTADNLARDLLGKVLRRRYKNILLSAQIIETEAYCLDDKASHGSLGFTEKRKAMFMPAGTIYMYYARGDDSLNISAKGDGSAVLIKSAIPYIEFNNPKMIALMQKLNPIKHSGKIREPERLCSGQTLLCRSLSIKVTDWNAKQFVNDEFYLEDVGYQVENTLAAKRLGIPEGRDEHLPYRFIDEKYKKYTTDRGRGVK